MVVINVCSNTIQASLISMFVPSLKDDGVNRTKKKVHVIDSVVHVYTCSRHTLFNGSTVLYLRMTHNIKREAHVLN